MNRLKAYLLNLPVASKWSELEPDQFVAIANILYRYSDPIEVRTRITWSLLRIGLRRPRRLAALIFGLSPLDRHTLTKLAEPFLNPDKLKDTLLPRLTAGRTVLHVAHNDLLNELDGYVWGLADAAFLRHNKRQDIDSLRFIAQLLYAPAGATREDRIKGTHAALIQQVPIEQLMALHLMWVGHRGFLVEHAPWVFRSSNQKKAERRKTGWSDVLLGISGSKFGPYNETCLTPAIVLLRELSHVLEHQAQERARMEALNKRRRA